MSKNYGAVLQAYALKRIFEKRWYDVEIINFNGLVGNETYKTYIRIHSLPDLLYNIKRFKFRKQIMESTKKFNNFRDLYFSLTKPYLDLKSLQEDPPHDDIYVVGSDQVWNPNIFFSPVYFLDFGIDSVKRFSYAASLGTNNIHEKYHDQFSKYLRRLNFISVRESFGVEHLKSLGFESTLVLDPTIMLDQNEWASLERDPGLSCEKDYILSYFLNYNESVYNKCLEFKKRSNLKIVNICSNIWNPPLGDYNLWNIGPEEFVWLVHHAKYIMTSSFHGTTFSIIFSKKFATFNFSKHDTRLSSLLDTLRISERLLTPDDSIDRIEKMINSCYNCDDELNAKRVLSDSFLDHALSK